MNLITKVCHRGTFIAAVAAVLISQGLTAQETQRAATFIVPDDLKADIAFLASDDLKGRDSGSEEDHIATDYIATQFMRLGLKPAGDNGTYFQNMEIDTANVDREHTTLTAKIAGAEHAYAFGEDFHWSRQSLHPASACGEVAFAGYGIDAPEYGYNDFAGIDVKGKVALVLGREPQADDANSKFAGTWDTYHAFYWEKLEELRKRGAAGLLLVQDRVRRPVKQTPASSPRASGGPSFALAGPMWDIPTFTISRKVADQLLAP
ncbi:MAG TPA: PA domain-containing protein, partial [Bryobacteraceae bacterium]|nr:PA domain-containing protein [Bryobacteraceae bacterium]